MELQEDFLQILAGSNTRGDLQSFYTQNWVHIDCHGIFVHLGCILQKDYQSFLLGKSKLGFHYLVHKWHLYRMEKAHKGWMEAV